MAGNIHIRPGWRNDETARESSSLEADELILRNKANWQNDCGLGIADCGLLPRACYLPPVRNKANFGLQVRSVPMRASGKRLTASLRAESLMRNKANLTSPPAGGRGSAVRNKANSLTDQGVKQSQSSTAADLGRRTYCTNKANLQEERLTVTAGQTKSYEEEIRTGVCEKQSQFVPSSL